MKLLKVAIVEQRWDVVAHTLVLSLVKAQQQKDNENGPKKKRSGR